MKYNLILLQTVKTGNILRFEDKNGSFVGVISDTSMLGGGIVKIMTNHKNHVGNAFLGKMLNEEKIWYAKYTISLITDKEYQQLYNNIKNNSHLCGILIHTLKNIDENNKKNKKMVVQILKRLYKAFPGEKRTIFQSFMLNTPAKEEFDLSLLIKKKKDKWFKHSKTYKLKKNASTS